MTDLPSQLIKSLAHQLKSSVMPKKQPNKDPPQTVVTIRHVVRKNNREPNSAKQRRNRTGQERVPSHHTRGPVAPQPPSTSLKHTPLLQHAPHTSPQNPAPSLWSVRFPLPHATLSTRPRPGSEQHQQPTLFHSAARTDNPSMRALSSASTGLLASVPLPKVFIHQQAPGSSARSHSSASS